MSETIHEKARRLEAENAQLREALGWYLKDHELAEQRTAHKTVVCGCSNCTQARAALSDTADGWLQRHDAEVREQERERCAGIADAEAETQRISLETFAAMQSARAIAAAIREGE